MMERHKICDDCGGKMLPTIIDQEFTVAGKNIVLKGLNAYKCVSCGEIVFEQEEVKMIEKLVHAFDDKPVIEVLNLEETAAFLRVSNQTIYNMIRDGRIKAYKVGREWRFLKKDIMGYINGTSNEFSLQHVDKVSQDIGHDAGSFLIR